jgi:hypothetical protein
MSGETTAVLARCASCGVPLNSSATVIGGLFYHPQCAPQTGWAAGIPMQPIDYARIREIVREEIRAATGDKKP